MRLFGISKDAKCLKCLKLSSVHFALDDSRVPSLRFQTLLSLAKVDAILCDVVV